MEEASLSNFFTTIDWVVVFGYLALTTFVGHLMRGKQASINDFFRGGRSLPWPAVSGSMIATEISGVTFIGVPGIVMAVQGDFTYLQWALGSIFARILVGIFFVPLFYKYDIFSPYDYMGHRLGHAIRTLATLIFTLGSILAQSVRVVVAALPLTIVTPFSFEICILIIGVFAIGWTLMGGMRTVIWTDVMQFFLFVGGGLFALFWMINGFQDGWSELIAKTRAVPVGEGEVINKMNPLNLSFDSKLGFTLWVALFAVPFQNLTAFGVDQLNAQRMFCCRSAQDARKAIIWSSVGQFITVLMLLVGAALFVFYRNNPPTDPTLVEVLGWQDGAPTKGDFVFPAWIVTELPVGIRGLILAGVFAAAISSLDSILTALSQTSLAIWLRDRKHDAHKLVGISRVLVIVWGLVLTGCTFAIEAIRDNVPILPFAFGMTTYSVGPLLGMFFLSWMNRGNFASIFAGVAVSMILTAFTRTDIWAFSGNNELFEALANLPTYQLNEEGTGVIPQLNSVWMWPITTMITVAIGLLGKRQVASEKICEKSA